MKLSVLERIVLWLLLTWGLCGCATSKQSESHTDYAQKVEEGEWTVKTWEWAPRSATHDGVDAGHLGADHDKARPPLAVPLVEPTSFPDPSTQGVLLRYSEEVHSPVKVETKLETDAEAKSSFRAGPGFWGSLGLGLAAVIGFLLWRKFR